MKPALIPSLLAALTLASHPSVASPQATAGGVCRPGDGILLEVSGEPTLSDTFTVAPDLTVTLPVIGVVKVAGVPRDSLTPYFTEALSQYLRHPVVRARAMVRLAIVGEVTRPGYYPVPVDAVFADALMAAGGPTKDAKVQSQYIERGEKRLLGPDEVRKALRGNSTIAQMDLRSGDAITVPRLQPRDTETIVRILAMAVTIPLAVITLSRY